MEEVLTPQRSDDTIVTGRQSVSDKAEHRERSTVPVYIMDRRSNEERAAQENSSADGAVSRAHRNIRRRSGVSRRSRLLLYAAVAAVGIAAGAAAACVAPVSAEAFSRSLIMAEDGGFMGMLLRRLLQCGAFLAAEYIVGYFAAGGLLVWIAPLIYALGTGLSAAAAAMLGGELLPVVFSVIYTAVLLFGAETSGEFSELLLRLVSGRSGSIVTDGAAAYHYTLRFCLYIGIMFFLAIVETGIRAGA